MLPNRFHIFYWHWSPLYFCPLAGRCGRAHWLTEWMLRWRQRIWKRLRTLRQRSKRSLSLPCQSRFTLTLNPSLRCCLIHVGSLPSFRVATLQMLKAWPRSIWWRRPFRSLRTGSLGCATMKRTLQTSWTSWSSRKRKGALEICPRCYSDSFTWFCCAWTSVEMWLCTDRCFSFSQGRSVCHSFRQSWTMDFSPGVTLMHSLCHQCFHLFTGHWIWNKLL